MKRDRGGKLCVCSADWVNTHRAKHYTARSNIEPAQISLHANGQSTPCSGGARDIGRGAESHTPGTASESFPHPPTLPCGKKKGRKHSDAGSSSCTPRRKREQLLHLLAPCSESEQREAAEGHRERGL